jgi:elongation factor Ts
MTVTTAQITAEMVKRLREETNAGMMDCKKALTETGGDHDAAVTLLREKGLATAGKLAGRATTEGRIASYIHGGKIGVLVEIGCNTDFVARNDEFGEFCNNVAMHIAAMGPQWVSREDVPEDLIEAERKIYLVQAEDKPEAVRGKIADGKLEKWFSENVLLEQNWMRGKEMLGKDTTIDEYRAQVMNSTGENVEIRRFARFVLGE